MTFSASSDCGLKELDAHLASRSYVGGFTPSQADIAVFATVKGCIDAKKFANAARWYCHISSFNAAQRSRFPGAAAACATTAAAAPCKTASPAAKPAAAKAAADDDDFDLFGDDDDEATKAWEEDFERRAKEAQAKIDARNAAKGVTLIAKSNIIFDIKPMDSETDMVALEAKVREIEMDGLVWAVGKLVDVAYGIKKLQIACVVEDDKVCTDDIEEKLMEFEDEVQSVDVACFTKV